LAVLLDGAEGIDFSFGDVRVLDSRRVRNVPRQSENKAWLTRRRNRLEYAENESWGACPQEVEDGRL
jgi:hypothetical protein